MRTDTDSIHREDPKEFHLGSFGGIKGREAGQIRQSEEKFLGATNTTRFSQFLDGQVRPASFEGSRSCIAGKKL